MKTLLTQALLALLCTVAHAQTLDNTFNGNGIAITNYPINAQSMCVQNDGNIIVAGPAHEQGIKLIRYTDGGQLDQSFGSQGLATDVFLGREIESAYVATQGDKIIVGGQYRTEDFQMLLFARRYEQDGNVDLTFGSGGIAVCTAVPEGNCGGANSDQLKSYYGGMISVYPDGKIQQSGTVRPFCGGGEQIPFSVRYMPDGEVDTSFYGEYGIGLYSSYKGMEVTAMLTRPDSSILIAGHGLGRANAADSGKVIPKAMLFLPSGYNPGGFAAELRTGMQGLESFEVAAMENYGEKFLIAGTLTENGKGKFAVAMIQKAWVTADIELRRDSSFGTNGIAVIDVALGGGELSSLLVADGKIIVGGRANSNGFTGNDMVLVRLNADGSVDGNFGNGGKIIQDNSNGYDDINVLRQHEGKLVVAGNSEQGFLNVNVVVMRYAGVISGISEPQGRIAVHPNPAASVISFETAGDGDWKIYDVRSLLVGSGCSPRGARQTVDVSGYAPGAYFIRCETESGAAVGRFVKQ